MHIFRHFFRVKMHILHQGAKKHSHLTIGESVFAMIRILVFFFKFIMKYSHI